MAVLLVVLALNVWVALGAVLTRRSTAGEELLAGLAILLWPVTLLGWTPVRRRG